MTCERGDMKQSADGVIVFGDDGVREIQITTGAGLAGRDRLLDELCDAVMNGVAPLHDGRFARGTVEAALAILTSSRQRREILL